MLESSVILLLLEILSPFQTFHNIEIGTVSVTALNESWFISRLHVRGSVPTVAS